ncbi:MAG: hypothetical protein IJ263_08280 [Paludibacteraceae bacterium]|nr:hypothetical protein [Paludibacteraceae bacterium]
MVDLKNPKLDDFEVIEAPVRKKTKKKPFVSFYKVKWGVIPRKEYKITNLPVGIL